MRHTCVTKNSPTTTTSYWSPKGEVLENDRAHLDALCAQRREVEAADSLAANIILIFFV